MRYCSSLYIITDSDIESSTEGYNIIYIIFNYTFPFYTLVDFVSHPNCDTTEPDIIMCYKSMYMHTIFMHQLCPYIGMVYITFAVL